MSDLKLLKCLYLTSRLPKNVLTPEPDLTTWPTQTKFLKLLDVKICWRVYLLVITESVFYDRIRKKILHPPPPFNIFFWKIIILISDSKKSTSGPNSKKKYWYKTRSISLRYLCVNNNLSKSQQNRQRSKILIILKKKIPNHAIFRLFTKLFSWFFFNVLASP